MEGKWEKVEEMKEYEAQMVKEVLEREGIPVLLRPVDYAIPAIFGSGGIVEILVPKDEVKRAREIISSLKEEG